MLNTAKGRKLYYLEFEYHDTFQKSLDKIKRYIKVTNLKAVSKKYCHPKGHRTFFVYRDRRLMERVINRLSKETESLGPWFLFKSYDELVSSMNLSFLLKTESLAPKAEYK